MKNIINPILIVLIICFGLIAIVNVYFSYDRQEIAKAVNENKPEAMEQHLDKKLIDIIKQEEAKKIELEKKQAFLYKWLIKNGVPKENIFLTNDREFLYVKLYSDSHYDFISDTLKDQILITNENRAIESVLYFKRNEIFKDIK